MDHNTAFLKNDAPCDILSLYPEELAAFMAELGEPAYRAKQIFTQLHKGTPLAEMTNLSKALREKLGKITENRIPKIIKKQVSSLDGTAKYLYELIDGETVEGVLMQYEHGNTLCVSTQVGCRMGCRFCASTLGGKIRDLTASEIIGQILAAETDSGKRVDGVVMMGMGEPLDNFDASVRFLRLVSNDDGLNISLRRISLSTCGLADKIDALAKIDLPITLSISLHAPTDEKRDAIMPVNKKYNLETLLSACDRYFKTTGRRISFEYTLIAGQNDSEADARILAGVLRKYMKGPLHVNLILLNPVEEKKELTAPDRSAALKFCAALKKFGINATIRRRLGPDIDAACGQLRRRTQQTSE